MTNSIATARGAAIAICLAFALPVRAEIVEVELPELAGAYPVSPGVFTRATTLQLARAPLVIHGASFRIHAGGTVGVADCGEPGQADTWPMEYVVEMSAGGSGTWFAYEEPNYVPGQFVATADFEGLAGTETWDFLLDGAADLTLSGAPSSAFGGCDPIIVPAGNVHEAYFVLDAEFPLPVEPTTWGKVKALYR